MREQAADRAARRIRRRQSALPGGDVRRGRARLRQPGALVGGRHSADHRRARLVDGGRRVSAGPVRLRDPGARPGQVFLAGPPLLRAATGEIATDEELGGAEMHATVSGARRISRRGRCRRHPYRARDHGASCRGTNSYRAAPQKSFKEPRYAAEELAGVVPADYRKPYDVREVIARIVDDSDFLDFKALYGPHTVCGHAEIEGHAVGFIGNNGPIDADGAGKAAQFIQLAARPTCRSSFCRTPPATWSAAKPSEPASSSTAPR